MNLKNVPLQNFLVQSTSQVRELAAAKLPRGTRNPIIVPMRRAAHNETDTLYYRIFGTPYHVLSDLLDSITELWVTLAFSPKPTKRELEPASQSSRTRKRSSRTASSISTFALNKGRNSAPIYKFLKRSNNTASAGKLGNQTRILNLNRNKTASPSARGLTNAGRNALKGSMKSPSNNTTRTAPPHYVSCCPRTTPIGQL